MKINRSREVRLAPVAAVGRAQPPVARTSTSGLTPRATLRKGERSVRRLLLAIIVVVGCTAPGTRIVRTQDCHVGAAGELAPTAIMRARVRRAAVGIQRLFSLDAAGQLKQGLAARVRASPSAGSSELRRTPRSVTAVPSRKRMSSASLKPAVFK